MDDRRDNTTDPVRDADNDNGQSISEVTAQTPSTIRRDGLNDSDDGSLRFSVSPDASSVSFDPTLHAQSATPRGYEPTPIADLPDQERQPTLRTAMPRRTMPLLHA